MKRKVKEALDKAGVDIPFPTRTLVIQKDEVDVRGTAKPVAVQ